MIILTVKRNLTWSVPEKKSLKMNRRDSSATLQHWSWCISTKHEGATRAHPDNWKMKAKKFFRAPRGLISIAATRLYAAAFCTLPPLLLTSSAASEATKGVEIMYNFCCFPVDPVLNSPEAFSVNPDSSVWRWRQYKDIKGSLHNNSLIHLYQVPKSALLQSAQNK